MRMTTLHPIDAATLLRRDGASLSANAPADYWNMAGPFGGATAALMMRAVLEDERLIGEPVSITVNFCGGIVQGGMTLDVRAVRTGKTVQHWVVELSQGGGIVATATVVTALRREGWRFVNNTMPDAPPPEMVEVLDRSQSIGWTTKYEMRFVAGAPVFERDDAGRNPRSVLWLNDKPRRVVDFVSLTSMSDAFFVRIVHARGDIPPVATVSMTTHFHATGVMLAAHGDQPLLCAADTKLFDQGFFDQTAEIWSPSQGLVATSTQMVWFKG